MVWYALGITLYAALVSVMLYASLRRNLGLAQDQQDAYDALIHARDAAARAAGYYDFQHLRDELAHAPTLPADEPERSYLEIAALVAGYRDAQHMYVRIDRERELAMRCG